MNNMRLKTCVVKLLVTYSNSNKKTKYRIHFQFFSKLQDARALPQKLTFEFQSVCKTVQNSLATLFTISLKKLPRYVEATQLQSQIQRREASV